MVPPKETTHKISLKGFFLSPSAHLHWRPRRHSFHLFLHLLLRGTDTKPQIIITLHDPIHIRVLVGERNRWSTDRRLVGARCGG